MLLNCRILMATTTTVDGNSCLQLNASSSTPAYGRLSVERAQVGV